MFPTSLGSDGSMVRAIWQSLIDCRDMVSVDSMHQNIPCECIEGEHLVLAPVNLPGPEDIFRTMALWLGPDLWKEGCWRGRGSLSLEPDNLSPSCQRLRAWLVALQLLFSIGQDPAWALPAQLAPWSGLAPWGGPSTEEVSHPPGHRKWTGPAL